ncbi:Coatomer subunit epsilon [Erysiphe neolycopersici]|uniref:Coatomer subunit epsilon n=1 Tax=Erysiphe neolycopersici TaxID=212602 RepID=A0A420HFX9_9PEZI|nr:Coatomer subunit epsilon [Erysiphe neolycopersici]
MDPLSLDDELLTLYNIFHQGQYEKAIEYDINSIKEDNKIASHVLKLRAKIALGKFDEVFDEVQTATETELVAIRALTEIMRGNQTEALREIESLEAVKGATLVIVGTVLQIAGKTDEALALLETHEGDLEAVALIVQIRLQQNRTDLALEEVSAAKKWAQDNLLVNLAESWVGLRIGGEKYQQAYYVFEELAQSPSTSSSQSLVAQAISEIHLGRLDEAEAALQQVLTKDKDNILAIVNSIVLNTIFGKDASQLAHQLEVIAPDHIFLQDIKEKDELFDKAALKYSAKVVAAAP